MFLDCSVWLHEERSDGDREREVRREMQNRGPLVHFSEDQGVACALVLWRLMLCKMAEDEESSR